MRTPSHKQGCPPCANTQLPTPQPPVERDRKVGQAKEPPLLPCPCEDGHGTQAGLSQGALSLHTPAPPAPQEAHAVLGSGHNSCHHPRHPTALLGSRTGLLPERLRGVKRSSVVQQPLLEHSWGRKCLQSSVHLATLRKASGYSHFIKLLW